MIQQEKTGMGDEPEAHCQICRRKDGKNKRYWIKAVLRESLQCS